MSEFSKVVKHLKSSIDQQKPSDARRLFHGRGQAFPDLQHITIDWLPPVILITLFSPESKYHIEWLTEEILSIIPACKSIQLQHRYELQGPIELIWGKSYQQLVINENQLKFYIQLGKSRNTGLFLDMKNGRKWVQNHAKGMRVLNLFAYTCGFSIAAMAGGAKSVLNVDMSSPALSVGRNNHRINEQPLSYIRFEKLNIFKSFGRLKKRGPFDLLICDPPTFQKGSVDIVKDYPKIIRRLNDFMAIESTLMLCLNAPGLSRDFLMDNMEKLAPQYKYLKEIKTPNIFKDAKKKGLKILIYRRSSASSEVKNI